MLQMQICLCHTEAKNLSKLFTLLTGTEHLVAQLQQHYS